MISGRPATRCECDICGEPITTAASGTVLQKTGGPAWHVHRGGCRQKALASLGWLRATQSLEEHLGTLAELRGATPCDIDNGAEQLSPAMVAEQLEARAWDDDVSDRDRQLFERGAVALRQTMRRCVELAAAGEHGEAKQSR
jgi:hypothetical protein